MGDDKLPKPSILDKATEIALERPEGVRGGVIVQGKEIGAEVSANVKKGEWTLGAVARWVTGKGKEAAAYVGWTPKG